MTDVPDWLKAPLAGRYAIERVIGVGGMATVYLAEDLKLHCPVAVKVLHPELATTLGAARFLREIEIAVGLSHTHILGIKDRGETDGSPWFVMDLVEGGSLRHRLLRDHTLALEDSLKIAREVLSALHYAHSKDVVHRDVKPENILFLQEDAIVADFGIARAISAAGREQITQAGLAIGTPAYMSPEQLLGDPRLDGRTDIYSLGCVLYEMLSGVPPSLGRAREYFGNDGAPVPVPSAIEQAIRKALSTEPDDRFTTGAAFAEALSAPSMAPSQSTPVITQPPRQSIAVLPFTNIGADPDNEYLSDGITEEIISALSRLQDLDVSPRTSSFAFKGKALEITQIAARLKVGTVLEGSVQKSGNRLRITAQLFDVRMDKPEHLWNERYDREMDDVFAVQDDIATKIAAGLKVTLPVAQVDTLVTPLTDNLDAYDLYLKGRSFWNRRGVWFKNALECFEEARKLDPDFASALAGLADTFCLLGVWGYIPAQVVHAKARPAAERAIAIEPKLPEGHYSLGIYQYYFGRDLIQAESELRKAMELNPNAGMPRAFLAQMLGLIGRTEEAVTLAARSQRLEPLSPVVQMVASLAYGACREYALSLQAARHALAIDSGLHTAYFAGGWSLFEAGNVDEGIQWLENSVQLSHGAPFPLTMLATFYERVGQSKKAEPLIRKLEARVEKGEVDQIFLAWINLARKHFETAFEQLTEAMQQRQMLAWATGSFPGLEGLYEDRRWCALLNDAGLGSVVELNRKRFGDTGERT